MSKINRMPLNDSQMGIYLECINNEDALQYNLTFEYNFDKSVDANKIKDSLEKILNNYAAFSTVIEVKNGNPELVLKDMKHTISLEEISDEKYKKIAASYAAPFRFNGTPLYKMAMYKTEKAVNVLFDIHHIIYDGMSFGILINNLQKLYAGEELKKEEFSILDATKMEIEHAKGEEIKESYKYFEKLLDGVETDSNILPDVADGDLDHCITYHRSINVPYKKVADFAKGIGCSANVVLLSAFSYALAKYTGQTSSLFTSIDSGRYKKPLENTMGFFVRTFPLYFEINEESSCKDYIQGVKETYFNSLKHDDVSFAKLAEDYKIRSDIKYVYQGEIFNDFMFDGTKVREIWHECDDAMSNLDFMLSSVDNVIKTRVTYRKGLYSKGNIKQFVSLFESIVNGLLEKKSLKDIVLVSEEDKTFIDELNKTENPYDEEQTVWDIVAPHVKEDGDKVAISYKGREITYKEFDSLTSKLAAYLKDKKIGNDDFVSVLIPRNEYMAITALGIVKAGAAYQPLDPSYPKDRLNFMVKDCGAKLLIADRSLRPILDEYSGDVLYTDEIDALKEAKFKPQDKKNGALVIIYTSGTTGTPKGCILENRNIVCFYHNHKSVFGLEKDSKVATYASFGFDAGIMDIFTTLMEGATLVVIPDEIRLDIMQMNEFYKENAITHGFMTTQVCRMFAEITDCKTLKALMAGGEKLVPFNPPKNINFINGYGPSETIAYVCHHYVKDSSAIQPIGVASGNTKLYVVDKYLRLLPAGACGELCISGNQVGRGYLNRPDKTSEVFVNNKFSKKATYERMYRTGDIVRLLPSGEMDFVGRRDGQVKIRGFRVELTEVEQVIREYPSIKNATVQAYDTPSGGKYIASFIVSDEKIDTSFLAAFIKERKPDYMVPEVMMQIDDIPLNANGKVDKKKLPTPKRDFEDVIKPQNDVQKRIFDNAVKVIGNDEFGINTSLFSAGLSSIGVIKLNVLLADEFGVSLTIKDLRKNDTVEKLEKYIASLCGDVKVEKKNDYPLTKTQEGIYIECISNPDAITYNIPLLLKIDSGLNASKLKDAIVTAFNAHSYLNTRLFTAQDGNVRQEKVEDKFTTNDIEIIYAKTIEEAKNQLLKPYKLIGGKLYRFALIHADGLYLYIDVHHIIGDGTSVNILLDDIAKAYAGEEVKDETFTGYDVASAEEKARSGEDLKTAREYYNNLFSEADSDFLLRADKYQDQEKASGCFEYNSSKECASKAEEFCKKNNLSMNGLLLSVFGTVLAKYNAEEYSVFTTVYNGRNDSRTSRTFAMLVKTLPVYVNIAGDSPKGLVKDVSDQMLDSMVNDVYSFAEISHDFGIRNDIMFIYQGMDFGFESFCGKKATEIPVVMEDKKAPICVQVYYNGSNFVYKVDYDNEKYTNDLMYAFVSAFDKALNEFTTCNKISEISMVDDKMLAKMDEFNKSDFTFDETQTMTSWFEKTCKTYPDNIAVVCEDRKYTYAELENLTARVAGYVQSKGIGKDDFVSILVERNEYMAIATYGVLRAGAAYEPLDPTYPLERLRFMIEDADAKLIIADRCLQHIIDGLNVDVLYTDEIPSLKENKNFKSNVDPDDSFVIIYTSGTTGVPKGNVLAHRNPVALFSWHLKDAEIDSTSRLGYFIGFSFDAGMADLHAALVAGATLYVITESMRLDLVAMDKFYCDNGITHSVNTTQMGSMFVKMTKCKTLKYYMVGGEKLVPFIPPKWVRFVNGYGPSECTVYSNRYTVKDDSTVQPIGESIGTLKQYIVDKNGLRLPIGAAGELCIAGKQVGKGYRNRPEKNAEVFQVNPFSKEKGYERMYHTGDVVRLLTDGNYDFIGRKDGQVKIRGFRIELAEVEQVIRSFEGIKNCTVQAYDDPAGGKFIAAFLVSDNPIDIQALCSFIGEKKPSYMIPAALMQIDKVPLTANGKVDKRALPTPERNNVKEGLEPADETEEAFCEIFEEVLGLDKVYADDDFFNIGGSSISAAQVVVKCDAKGFNVVFKNLFENPTPQQLAQFVNGAKSEDIVAPQGKEKEKYDYSCLDYNVIANLPNIKKGKLGDVLLTGVTGFLGAHVYKALMEMTDGKVICLIRSKGEMSAKDRFQMIVTYYFEDWFNDEYAKRTEVVEADLDDEDIAEKLKGIHIDTIINNAANVKHFAKSESLLKDNFEGVEHLIQVAEKFNAKLIQASSLSVCGESVNGSIPADFKFKEFNLNIGQSLENKYVYSKYLAEQAIIDAISRGRIKGKIIRLGNLAARDSDGEFQINPSNNGLLKIIQGYLNLGCYPVDMMDATIEFSPIDKVAEAMVLLAGTPDEFTVFHAKNCHEIHYGYIIHALNDKGYKVDIVESDVFEARFKKALEEEEDVSMYTGFIAYLNRADESVTNVMVYNDDEKNSKKEEEKKYDTRVKVSSDTAFTTKALYRLGFSWPLTSKEYLDSMIDMLDDKAFF